MAKTVFSRLAGLRAGFRFQLPEYRFPLDRRFKRKEYDYARSRGVRWSLHQFVEEPSWQDCLRAYRRWGGGCLSNATLLSDGPSCPASSDAETVSCITDHPKLDLRPTTAPLVWGSSDQAFVLRNRPQETFFTGTTGIGLFERVSDSWEELGEPDRRTVTGVIVPSGGSIAWKVTFSEAADDVSVTEYAVSLPSLDAGTYAVTTIGSFGRDERVACGSVFELHAQTRQS